MRKKQKEQMQRILELSKQIIIVLDDLQRQKHNEYDGSAKQEVLEAIFLIRKQMELSEANLVDSMNVEKLKELLQETEEKLMEIPVKKLTVFLPYKASMWDSLESVWKAAQADPDCESYVIPIPYFDRNEHGQLGKMHYEGDLYPKDVPITSYKDFDLAEQMPDQIFIHNPYDEYNMVTSVHPDYYSLKLKDYTEELVYIPYFVLDEVDPENVQAVKQMEHFCKVPGVLHAHKVIVQSPQMKEVYVKVLTEWMGENTRSTWEEKILGLGSPKLDKVLSTQKEDLEIPKEWLSIIEKPDKSWKKIVFYNTSLTAFLEHSDIYVEKIRNVLKVFQEVQEDITLLWRPHPLMITTMETMRPEIKADYIALVECYQKEGWGIYDDTPDLDRAICLSDAYFGDPSSVVQLCKKAGMPVMIQDVEITY